MAIDFVRPDDGCLVVEGCVGGPGERRVLRFATRIANVGCDDYHVGPAPRNASSAAEAAAIVAATAAPGWSWHQCHKHWHYEDYARYSLRALCDGRELAYEDRPVLGRKNGWCVEDADGYAPLGDAAWLACARKYTCEHMGISSGCFDEYAANLPCQWIDVTDAADGEYWLEVTANWDATTRDETTPEVSYENNAAWVAVRIEGAAVTVLDDDEVERVC